MKKITVLILTLALALSMAACTGGKGKGSSTGSDLTQAQIDRAVEKMEREEAKANK